MKIKREKKWASATRSILKKHFLQDGVVIARKSKIWYWHYQLISLENVDESFNILY